MQANGLVNLLVDLAARLYFFGREPIPLNQKRVEWAPGWNPLKGVSCVHLLLA